MNEKTELRNKAKVVRKNLDTEKISVQLCCLVRENEAYRGAKNVMMFYPKAEEFDFRALLSDDKNFYLPRVSGDELEVCPYRIGDNLKKSEFGVLEPESDKVDPNVLDLVIVPALMADKNGYRLGYGGGYYDRFFEDLETAAAVICREETMTAAIPTDAHDVTFKIVVSERGTYRND
jgi:5-formyltetrahydrofolate cyclo-ligase